jgi:hypothetical protein
MGYGVAPGSTSNALNCVSPRSLIMKKSPKKRTQSEMLNIENAGKFHSSNGLNVVDATSANTIKIFESEGITNRSLQSDILSEQSSSISTPATTPKVAAIISNSSSTTSAPLTATSITTSVAAANRISTEESAAGHRRIASVDAIPSFFVPGNEQSLFFYNSFIVFHYYHQLYDSLLYKLVFLLAF